MDNTDENVESLPTSRGRRSLYRALLVAAACAALVLLIGFLLLNFLVAERLPGLTEATLEAAMKLWGEHGPASYDLDVELRGARPGSVHVEVRAGKVTAQTRDGREPPPRTWDTWSVPGMFDTLAQDLTIASNPEQQIQAAPGTTWRLRCEFDPQYGYPRQYHRWVASGPEVSWRITKFTPR